MLAATRFKHTSEYSVCVHFRFKAAHNAFNLASSKCTTSAFHVEWTRQRSRHRSLAHPTHICVGLARSGDYTAQQAVLANHLRLHVQLHLPALWCPGRH